MSSWRITTVEENDKEIEIAFIDNNNFVSGVLAEAVKKRLVAGGWPGRTPQDVYAMSSRIGVEEILTNPPV